MILAASRSLIGDEYQIIRLYFESHLLADLATGREPWVFPLSYGSTRKGPARTIGVADFQQLSIMPHGDGSASKVLAFQLDPADVSPVGEPQKRIS